MAPQAKLYLFDLSGYGKQAINMERNDVFLIAGWSDKVFDMLDAVENSDSVLKQIEAMVI